MICARRSFHRLRIHSTLASRQFSSPASHPQITAKSRLSWKWISGAVLIGTSIVLVPSILSEIYQKEQSTDALQKENQSDSITHSTSSGNGFMNANVNRKYLEDAETLKGVYLWGTNLPAFLSQSAKNGKDFVVTLAEFEKQPIRYAAGVKGLTGIVAGNGDVFKLTDSGCIKILSGFDIQQLAISAADRSFFAHSKTGRIFRIAADQEPLQDKSSWSWIYSLFTGKVLPDHASVVELPPLKFGERVERISAENSRLTAITNHGRLLTQSWDNSDKSSDVRRLSFIQSVNHILFEDTVSGDNHTLIRSRDGRIFGMGSNKNGQLGLSQESDASIIHTPIEIDTVWKNDGRPHAKPNGMKCTHIAAGGDTSLIGIESDTENRIVGTGVGQSGQLGNGSFSNIAFYPVEVRKISSMKEFDEKSNKVVPIAIKRLQVGPSGTCVAVLSGPSATKDSPCDVLAWGSNQQGLLRRIDGKAGNSSSPLWVRAIDYDRVTANTNLETSEQNNESSPHRLALTEKQNIALLDGFGMIFTRK